MRSVPANDSDDKLSSWSISTVLLALSMLLLLPLLAFLVLGIQVEMNRIRARMESAAMNVAQISAHSL